MPPAAASEKEGRNWGLPVPQTPAGGLRPPAPPAQEVPLLISDKDAEDNLR